MWPALDAAGGNSDFLLAELDDYSPTALEDHGAAVRIFFSSHTSRDAAFTHLVGRGLQASPVDVPDDDWARRSQEAITPISVGRIVVTPPWHANPSCAGLQVLITPSMGFGTGHHATTRLCLAALQSLDLSGREVLDVGTGSGVLAIAARMLGAQRAKGIDNDAEAIQSAVENLRLNPTASDVTFQLFDLSNGLGSACADVVTANLTGAVLQRAAHTILTAARPGGTIIVSGLMIPERPAVEGAFSRAQQLQAWEEDEWAALAFRT
jgi:ribosomal protein L11 methyltransferase